MNSRFDKERRMDGVPRAENARKPTIRLITRPIRGGFELLKRFMKPSILTLITKAQKLGGNGIRLLVRKSMQLGLGAIPRKLTLIESFATRFAMASSLGPRLVSDAVSKRASKLTMPITQSRLRSNGFAIVAIEASMLNDWETLKALAILLSMTAAMAALILTVAHFIK
jgi:hypothetical protein